MKKFLTFLAVLLISVTGIFAGCEEDKYAEARVSVTSPALVGDVLTMGYDNTVQVTGKTTGIKDINYAVNFTCDDTEALEFTGLSNGANGTTVTIKAKKPTYGNNYFVLKASSVETNSVYKEIKVKVILPIEAVNFGNAILAVSPSTPLRLNEYLHFYPQAPYVTNQKDVIYNISDYGLNSASDIVLDSKTGLLTVADTVIDNLASDSSCLEVTVISLANDALRSTIKINVVKDLTDEDVRIESSQLAYNIEHVENKKELILFTNSESYYREEVIVDIISSQDIEILPIKLESNNSNPNIIEITQLGNIVKTPIDGVNFKNRATFEIRAKSSAGSCDIKFRVKTIGVDSPLTFNFSDDVIITAKTSALPKGITLKQDAKTVVLGEALAVYNEYVATETTSNHGTKLVPTVVSDSATSISESNKYVKVNIYKAGTTDDATSLFTITSIKGEPIVPEDGTFEILSNNAFYLKATDDAVGNTFRLVFSTQIKEFISYAAGGAPAVEDEQVIAEYFISANYGVKEINFEQASYITKLYRATDSDFTETLITFSVNENADISGIKAEYNNAILSVTKIDIFSYVVVGKTVGSSEFRIIANNGFSKRVTVKVVDQFISASVSIDSPTVSQVITEANYESGQLLSASAKTGGRFNVYTRITPGISGIIKTTYASSDEVVATVSSNGLISTKNAGVAKITVYLDYYQFYNDDGYATYREERKEISFDLTVFTPTRSITLSRTVATIYSYDSLGYEYKDRSVVEVYAQISPVTATIYGDEDAVSYSLLNNGTGILSQDGAKGRFRANLPEGVNEATVLIVVTVTEYGTSVSLVCTVNIIRAVQIKEITINNLEKVATGYYLLDMKEDESFTLEISLTPEKVFVSDLYVALYEEIDGELIPIVTESIVSIEGKTIISKETLEPSDPTSIYVRLYAKDNMYNLTEGTVYETIFVTIETGKLNSPYLIENADDLQAIKNAPTKHYMLKNDIDLSGRNWEPIKNFSGSINGIYYRKTGEDIFYKNNKITGLALNSTSGEFVGLFANTTLTSLLFNLDLSVSSALISASKDLVAAGALVGENRGLVLNCAVSLGNSFIVQASSDGSLLGKSIYAGGMVGANYGYVYNFAPFKLNGDDEFERQFTAESIEDLSVPTEYVEIIGDSDSFLTIGLTYKDGTFPTSSAANESIDLAEVNLIIDALTSANPVSGKLIYRDSIVCAVNAGGLVGYNEGFINGVYGLYNAQEETSTLASGDEEENQFLISNSLSASINSEGKDVSAVITPNGVNINSQNTTAGGVVGYSKGGGIFNVASAGKVEGHYNVGGIIGKMDSEAILKTASSCARITGFQNVGGAIGVAINSNITLVKVENYQETVAGGDILIIGNNNVGGVVGLIEQSRLNFAYAVSFVEESTFTAGLAPAEQKADIYNNGNLREMYVGGVAGYVGAGCNLEFVYSTMSIYTSTADSGSFAGGIAGALYYNSRILSSYYLGKFVRIPVGKTGSVAGTIANGLAMAETPSVENNIIRYFFSTSFYPAVGRDEKPCFNTADNSVIINVVSAGALSTFSPTGEVAENWELGTSLNIKNGIKFPVIKYTSEPLNREVYFIKQTPTAVTATIKDPGPDGRFYKIKNAVILLTYSANQANNEYRIKDLMTFSWEPDSIKTSSLRVTSTANNIVEVQEDGLLVVKGAGMATLTFTSVLNLNANCTVDVVVIPKISGVAMYDDSNLTNNLIGGAALEMKKDTNQKVFPTFYDYDAHGKKVIVDAGYYVTYTYENAIPAVDRHISIDQETSIIAALKETETPIEVAFTTAISVDYVYGGSQTGNLIYNPFEKLANAGQKKFTVSVYTGASDLIISPNSGNEITAFAPQYLSIELVSDAKEDGVKLEIIDDYGNVIIKNGSHVSINDPYTLYSLVPAEPGAVSQGQQKLDEIGFMLDIDYIESTFVMSPGNYFAQIYLKVDDDKKYYTEAKGYTFRFRADSTPALVREVRVVVVPQVLMNIEDTYRVLEGTEISTTGVESYIFQQRPVDKIVPGKLGLISINVFPEYAGVEYYKIETIPEAMPYINFAQLYKDKSNGASGLSYIFGLNAEPIPNGLKLNRLSNYLKTVYTLSDHTTTETLPELLEDSNNTIDVIAIDNVYDFDGNIYVEILTSNTIYELETFPITITAVYADGTEVSYYRDFETTYLPALTLETSRDFIALGYRENKDGSKTKDYVDIEAKVDGNYNVNMDFSVIKHGMDSDTEGVAVFSASGGKGRVTLSENAQAGDKIRISANYQIVVEGRIETVTAYTDILIVDAVIDDVVIEKAVDDRLMFTISSSQQLQATLTGCADTAIMSKLSTIISRQLTRSNTIAFWKYVYGNGAVTSIDDRSLNLPFGIDIKKVSTEDAEGLASISLVGSTVSGSANLMLRAYRYYDNEGQIHFAETIDENCLFPDLIEVPFTAQVIVDSTDDLPTPIKDYGDLLSMAEGGNYILMNDLDINEPFSPIQTNIASFDGNNKIITISNFAYDTSTESMTSNSINLGLFASVSADTVIKNVIVALPNNKENPMMLNNYININFGGIAGINAGIITNCEVISTYDKKLYNDETAGLADGDKKLEMYKHLGYTYNIYTATNIDGTAVVANIGGLVGQNASTGVITNSRVGRNFVEYVEIQEDDYNGTNPNIQIYKYTAPVTIIKLEGSGNIGGFVANNAGTISSSYFANGQMEISAYGSNYIKTGGFAAINSGAIYSSYSAGWEEEDYISGYTGTVSTYLSRDPNKGNSYYTVSASLLNSNRKLGGGIYSNGNIGGFVYANENGYVQNCYSNICLNGDYSFAANRKNISSNSILTEYGNLSAGGFVFKNVGKARIETSYTISKIKSNISAHGPFVGVSTSSGDVNNEEDCEVSKCYYLIEKGENIFNESDPAYNISQSNDSTPTEGEEGEGDVEISLGNEFIIKDTFAGFSFDNDYYSSDMNSGAVWAMKLISSAAADSEDSQNDYGYPELVSANKVAMSVRVLKPNSQAGEGEADYTYVYALGFEKGSDLNPQIITSATDYNRIFENILNVTVPFENVNVKYTGNLRLVNNIDFTTLTPASSSFEFTSPINRKSVFDGNNLAISNVLLSDESESNTAFGLFKVLNNVGVKNLTLTIRSVGSTNGVAVGALTGIAVESDINNINIAAASAGAEVSGQNYVGGLAGIIVSGDEVDMHYINNINVNVSTLASFDVLSTQNIIKSAEIWSLIIPPARINPYSSDYNLRLQYLKKNVSYAGGIAGAIDLKQAFFSAGEDSASESLDNVNARALSVGQLDIFTNNAVIIQADNVTSVEAGYAGGLFGFIGEETFIREASFEAYTQSEEHYIMGDIAAGGITAINYGFIDQTEVTYDKKTQESLDRYLENFVEGTTGITWGNQNLYTGSPTYIGGIAAINIGGTLINSGTIQNSYNRIDLCNRNATRIGGIVGATHVGAIVNAYTTANIVGNFTVEDSYYGAIIGQLLNNENNKYYTVALKKDDENDFNLELTNITVATIWNPEYFEEYKLYTDTFVTEDTTTYVTYKSNEFNRDTNAKGEYLYDSDKNGVIDDDEKVPAVVNTYVKEYGQKVVLYKGRIGALYGSPTAADAASGSNPNIYRYYDHYVNEISGDNVILSTKIYENFAPGESKTVDLFCGIQELSDDGLSTQDSAGSLHYYLSADPSLVAASTLSKDEFVDLYTIEVGAGSNAKDKAFSTKYWSSRVWNFDDSERLISLNFGYIPSIVRIYTADDFIREVQDSPAAKKYYYIMNDIDFSAHAAADIYVAANFRGTVVGMPQTNESGTMTRYPILYNIRLSDETIQGSGGGDTVAMFHNTTNASFYHLNIVISEYKEDFPEEGETSLRVPTIKKTSVLIANANTTTINDVHIGYRVGHFAKNFLTAGTTDGSSYILSESDGGLSNVELLDLDLGLKNNFAGISTFGTCFGGIVSDGLSTTIKNCSFNIPVEVIYQNELIPETGNIELCVGGIAGKLSGTVSRAYVTRNLGVYAKVDTTRAKVIYIGGAVGWAAGNFNNIGFGSPEENASSTFIANWRDKVNNRQPTTDRGKLVVAVATSSRKTVVTQKYGSGYNANVIATDRTYVGGVLGYATALINVTTSVDSKIDSLYNYNSNIIVENAGIVDVGGVVGRNEIPASWLQYKNKTLAANGIQVYANKNSVEANIGAVIGVNSSDTALTQVYTNAKVYVERTENGTALTSVGGVVGKSETTATLNSIMNEASDIIVNATTGTFYTGGIVGNVSKSSSTKLKLEYVLSTAYIQFTATTGSTTVLVGGMIGSSSSGVTVVNAVGLGNIYIEKAASIYSLKAGGFVGEAVSVTKAVLGGGLVIASNINYTGIGSREIFSIGQLAGSITNVGDSVFTDMYYCENLFGLCLNDYCAKDASGTTTTNVIMENLQTPINSVFRTHEAADFGQYLQSFEAEATQIYESKITDYLYFTSQMGPSGLEYMLKGVEGSKLNPAKLELSNLLDLASDTYTYYKMTEDISAGNPTYQKIDINTGNFIDARGYTITHGGTSITTAIFGTVAKEAFVVGLLVPEANIISTNSNAAIAITNQGTLLGCGSAGTIQAKDVAGIVHTNTGNIINCFSIATIRATDGGKAAGIAISNGGNIITSYYTGNLEHVTNSATIAGLAYASAGYITNSYTMSNIINAAPLGGNTAALIYSGDVNHLKFVYYDRNAYTGSATGLNASYTDKGRTTAELSKLGAVGGAEIRGNWFQSSRLIGPGETSDDLKTLYLSVYEDHGETFQSTQVNSSWFNYSYSIANINGNIPVLLGSDGETITLTIKRFLDMLYTGNGKKEDGFSTNNFKNTPFRITNAGMMESYFLAGSGNGAEKKSYYILMNDISFKAYDEWSETWNAATEKPVVFQGDFNGNNKTMYGIGSSYYGIFRIIGEGAYVYNFTITDIKSQTGLLAGGILSGAVIENIFVDSTNATAAKPNNAICYVYNGGITSLKVSSSNYLYSEKSLAGGVIGYQAGGTIGKMTFEGALSVYAEDYAGGVVGYAVGQTAKIDLSGANTADYDPFEDLLIDITADEGSAGGMIGYSEIEIKNYLLTSEVDVWGEVSSGGFIGDVYSYNTTLTYLNLTNNDVTLAYDSSTYKGGIVGRILSTSTDGMITFNGCENCGYVEDATIAGGIVGRASFVTLVNPSNANGVYIAATISAGGFIGEMAGASDDPNAETYIPTNSKLIMETSDIGTFNSGVDISASHSTKTSYAGGVVGRMGNGRISGKSSKLLTNEGSVSADIAGNIVGYVRSIDNENTQLNKDTNFGVEITQVKADISNISAEEYFGGVVGRVYALNVSYVNIHHITLEGTVSSDATYVGGVTGRYDYYVLIHDITANITFTINGENTKYTGGIVGYTNTAYQGDSLYSVSNVGTAALPSSVTINHTGGGANYCNEMGGVYGYGENVKIYGAHIKISISSVNEDYVYAGGIIGSAVDSIVESSSVAVKKIEIKDPDTATDSPSSNYAGGIAGYMNDSSFTSVTVTFEETSDAISADKAGGIVGYVLDGSITAAVVGTTGTNTKKIAGKHAGGIVGGGQVSFGDGTCSVAKNITIVSNSNDAAALGGIGGRLKLASEISATTKFTVNASVLGGARDKAGGIIGEFRGGSITGSLSGGITANLVVNGTVQGRDIGYLIGFAMSNDSDCPVEISQIHLAKATTNGTKDFKLIPMNDNSTVGYIIGGISASEDTALSDFKNLRNFEFTTANLSKIKHFGGIIGEISVSGSSTVTITKFMNEGHFTKAADATYSGKETYIGGFIGQSSASSNSKVVLDGTVSKMKNSGNIDVAVSNSDGMVGGIIGYAEETTIKNTINASNISVKGVADVGGIVGRTGANTIIASTVADTIMNGNITVTDKGGSYVGGVVGFVNGATEVSGGATGKKITVKGTITGTEGSSYNRMGGVVGVIRTSTGICTVKYVIVNTFTITSNHIAAALVGQIESCQTDAVTIEDCIATTSIDINAPQCAGGAVGYMTATLGVKIKQVEITADFGRVSDTMNYAGGIIAEMNNASAIISGTSAKPCKVTSSKMDATTHAGGIVGYINNGYTQMTYVTSLSNTIKAAWDPGGFVGHANSVNASNSFSNCTSEDNEIVSTNNSAGGVYGYISSGEVSISSFDITIKNNEVEAGTGNAGVVAGYIDGSSKANSYYGFSSTTISSGNSVNSNTSGAIGYAADAKIAYLEIDNQDISLISSKAGRYGSIAGHIVNVDLRSCDSDSDVDMQITENGAYIGGIVGHANNSTVYGCDHWKGRVDNNALSGKYSSYCGGVVGYADGTTVVDNSYSQGTAVQSGRSGGGIVGHAEFGSGSKIVDCYNTSSVSVYNNGGSVQNDTPVNAGGIIGYSNGGVTIEDCINSGNVRGYYEDPDYDLLDPFHNDKSGNAAYFKFGVTPTSYDNNPLDCHVGGIAGVMYNGTIRDCTVSASEVRAYISKDGSKESIGLVTAVYSKDGEFIWDWGKVEIKFKLYTGTVVGYNSGSSITGNRVENTLNTESKVAGEQGYNIDWKSKEYTWGWGSEENNFEEAFGDLIEDNT